MKAEMFKKLQDFINDIKGQDEDLPSIEGANDRDFFVKMMDAHLNQSIKRRNLVCLMN